MNITTCFVQNLLDFQQLDVEDKSAVRWDSRKCFAAVSKLCGNGKSSLAANLHASNTNIPPLDDLAFAKLEREWLALLVCYELLVFRLF